MCPPKPSDESVFHSLFPIFILNKGGFDIKKPTVYMPLKKKAKLYHYAFNNHFARAYFKAELNVFEIKKEFPRLVAVSRLNSPECLTIYP